MSLWDLIHFSKSHVRCHLWGLAVKHIQTFCSVPSTTTSVNPSDHQLHLSHKPHVGLRKDVQSVQSSDRRPDSTPSHGCNAVITTNFLWNQTLNPSLKQWRSSPCIQQLLNITFIYKHVGQSEWILTTNRVSPVPPAFPTNIPELAWKVRGWGLLLKATRWYSSQSMYRRTWSKKKKTASSSHSRSWGVRKTLIHWNIVIFSFMICSNVSNIVAPVSRYLSCGQNRVNTHP